MTQLLSLEAELKSLPKSVPGTSTIFEKIGNYILYASLANILYDAVCAENTKASDYFFPCGIGAIGLFVSLIDFNITKKNISKFDSAFNNKPIYFQDSSGHIMKSILQPQYVQNITQCDVEFIYSQPELCTPQEIQDLMS